MLTNPKNFPKKTGINPAREDRTVFKKVAEVFIKPATHKVIEKYLWVEAMLTIALFFTGLSELIGHRPSKLWYLFLFILLALFIVKVLTKEDIIVVENREEIKGEVDK